jgi:arginyl-tRNA synthetase
MTVYSIGEARAQARQALSRTLSALGHKTAAEVERPRDLALGDLAWSGAFELAKAAKKNPLQLAEEVAVRFNELLKGGESPLVEKASAAKGYVNVTLSRRFFEAASNQAAALGKDYGRGSAGEGRAAVVEYSQPNVGKPMHVGHIRSTILGDAVKRLLEFQGYRAIGFNYLGDSGAQVAKLILATRVLGEQLPKITDEKDLLQYYVAIHKRIEEKPELEVESQAILKKIELGDAEVLPDVEKIRALSIPAFQKNYDLLDVSFDEVTGESAFIGNAKKVVQECLEKGVAFKADTGEVVAKLEEHGVPNTILLRSNGTTIYLSRDLGLADYKWSRYKPDLLYICTDARQNLHFQQVKKVLELLKREYAGRLHHQGFGYITLPEGLMSTREGRVVLLEDVLSQAVGEAKKEIREERKGEYSEEQASEIARAVGIAATKFAVLRVAPEKNVVFDFRQMVRFSGDTGAYLQYTLVRTRGILGKAGTAPFEKQLVVFSQLAPEERALVRLLADFPTVAEYAARRFLPHVLCEHLLEVAAAFSDFYEKQPVLKAESAALRDQRLRIVQATRTVLENGLRLLGIRAPEKM